MSKEMDDPREIKIEDYNYQLPNDTIAKYPLEQRDSSKLLIYQQGTITEDTYKNIAAHIPNSFLMVFNRTKVVHARLLFTKETGGQIEVFCLEPHGIFLDIQTAMLQKGTVLWRCLLGGAGKWKHGAVITANHQHPDFTLSARIVDKSEGSYIIELSWSDRSITFSEVLYWAGRVPLPPYLHRDATPDDEQRYQTIFATEEGSVAAPTAALHFTDAVMHRLADRSVAVTFITLHVGAGTFQPVKSVHLGDHQMHSEWMDVSMTTMQQIIDHVDTGIVAVGTTSLRTLESLYWIGVGIINGKDPNLGGIAVTQWEPYRSKNATPPRDALIALLQWMNKYQLSRIVTQTQIIIAPGYRLLIAKGLVTNFHQPQSTLLLLISALVGDDWRRIYEYALANSYRFLSYGDGSLLWNNNLSTSMPAL